MSKKRFNHDIIWSIQDFRLYVFVAYTTAIILYVLKVVMEYGVSYLFHYPNSIVNYSIILGYSIVGVTSIYMWGDYD